MSDRSNRMMQGCEHSVVIRVPCGSCVEGRIENLVRGAKHESREQTKDEYKDTIAGLQKYAGQLDMIKSTVEQLMKDKQAMTDKIVADSIEIKRLRGQASDLAASLSAERNSRIVFNKRDDEDE